MKYFLVLFFLTLSLFAQMPKSEGHLPPSPSAPAPEGYLSKDKAVKVEALAFRIPKNWNKNKQKDLWVDSNGTSINVASVGVFYSFDKFVKLNVDGMKKAIKTYKLLENGKGKGKNIDYLWYLGTYDLKEIGGAGYIMIYTVFMDAVKRRYVITIGVRKENFENYKNVINKIMSSFYLDKDYKYKNNVDNKGGLIKINGKISMIVPKGWEKKKDKYVWIDPKTRSSVNVTTENSNMNLNDYMELSLKTLKNTVPSYKLLEKKIITVNGNDIGMLLGEFNMYNTDIKLYSLALDVDGVKYVISIGGPKVSFDGLLPTFKKIIDSVNKL